MNIQFADKLSSHVWSNMMDQPSHAEELTQWMVRFMHGGWQNCRDGDVTFNDRGDYTAIAFDQQAGTIQTLHIAVATRDTENHPEAGAITHEFNWTVSSIPVDKYGQPDTAHHTLTRLINGGLINHGDFDQPRWSSHT